MKQPPLDAAGFRALTGCDPAALARLEAYLALLRRWQSRINLVGPATLADPWRRHLLDCAQLAPFLPAGGCRLLDLGAGAGLPGLVLAVIAPLEVTLIDSDTRKCAFLREAIRLLEVPATVVPRRIDEAPRDVVGEVVTARALAPLDRLLPLAWPRLAAGGRCLFLKGHRVDDELTRAAKHWKMRITRHASCSDPHGVIVELEEIEPRHDP